NFFRYILVAADEIVVIKQIAPVMHAQNDCPGNIHGGPASDPHDAIAPGRRKHVAAPHYIALHRVLADTRIYLHGQTSRPQARHDIRKESQPLNHRVRHEQRAPKTHCRQMVRQFADHSGSEPDRSWKIVLSYRIEICHMISKYLFSSQSVTTWPNCRHSHSRVRIK